MRQDDGYWRVESGARPKRPEYLRRRCQTRRSARPDDGYWPVESETRPKRPEYPRFRCGTRRSAGPGDRFWSGSRSAGRTPNRNHPSNKRSERSNAYRSRRHERQQVAPSGEHERPTETTRPQLAQRRRDPHPPTDPLLHNPLERRRALHMRRVREEIERRHAKDLSADEFHRVYFASSTPVIVVGAMEGFAAMKTWRLEELSVGRLFVRAGRRVHVEIAD